jgi:hypothetical protein
MGQVERHPHFIATARQKLRDYFQSLSVENRVPLILTYREIAVISGISVSTLQQLQGKRMAIEVTSSGISLEFTPNRNFLAQAYKTASQLLQLSASGQAEDYLRLLEGERLPELNQLQDEVPGFSDFLDSVRARAISGHPHEAIWQQLRLTSWYEAIPAGLKADLVRPEQIFTTPG